ncbi:D-3-phosphoglycerate dehydrogenase [Rubellimicrobium mesophilum DSM 19309]|uniref:D-3-phosphoglycerate dehydrogenase n=1 Tax=Rubellimicrobium mesophilum DSM 19309 TaxID=442562 RepID=A0A017HHI8_9RHOB|nr:2-hydroxyacid dehydrogenase [Rubellimicrobium mesophilum]EYD73962.1 D-3-phosphoglycerate dehydrogenase [Rubellimicrobium mesophilum DSM 19309]
MIPAVLVLQPLSPARQSELEAACEVHRLDLSDEPDLLLDRFGPRIEAVVTDGHKGLTAAQIGRLPNLRLVASGSAGLEGIDRAALKARDIPLTNPAVALAEEVADVALMLLLAGWKALPALDAHVRTGAWANGEFPLGRALQGRTLGILGLGTIGSAVAKRAESFGLRIAYTTRTPREVPYEHEPSLFRLAERSDILVVIVPGGPETAKMVNAEVLDALGPEGLLVNVARGSIVDEPALIEALATGRLGGAALDVMWNEPRPDPRLTGLPNVVLTPHVGSATRETRDAMSANVLANLRAHFAGEPLVSEV